VLRWFWSGNRHEDDAEVYSAAVYFHSSRLTNSPELAVVCVSFAMRQRLGAEPEIDSNMGEHIEKASPFQNRNVDLL
jgi:hypothetical protein